MKINNYNQLYKREERKNIQTRKIVKIRLMMMTMILDSNTEVLNKNDQFLLKRKEYKNLNKTEKIIRIKRQEIIIILHKNILKETINKINIHILHTILIQDLTISSRWVLKILITIKVIQINRIIITFTGHKIILIHIQMDTTQIILIQMEAVV
jgi:hypothetical protein